MNRSDFKKLAVLRIAEARVLLQNEKYDGAFYLAGYAVECGLKACIAKRTKKYDFPPEPTFVRECYTHAFETLLKAADLDAQRNRDIKLNPRLEANWGLVKRWKETRRYERSTRVEAEELLAAITEDTDGVLTWIKRHW